jgi:tetratricopeptide (TPR) repeat protein
MAGWRKWHLAALVIVALASTGAEPTPLRAQEGDELATLGAQVSRLYQAGQYAEGFPLAEQYSEAVLTRYGANAAQYVAALNDLAGFLSATKRFKEAEAIYRRILAIDESNLGPEHADVSTDLAHLAHVLRNSHRPAEPEKLMRRALAIDERVYGSEHPRVATSLYRLADLLGGWGAEPVSLVRRALAIDEKALGPRHPDVARDLTKLAEALYHNYDDDPDLQAEGWKLSMPQRAGQVIV